MVELKLYVNEEAVQRFLAHKRWSGRDLARKLQVAPSTISRMRRHERSVSGFVMKRLLDVTNGYLTYEQLFTCRQSLSAHLECVSATADEARVSEMCKGVRA